MGIFGWYRFLSVEFVFVFFSFFFFFFLFFFYAFYSCSYFEQRWIVIFPVIVTHALNLVTSYVRNHPSIHVHDLVPRTAIIFVPPLESVIVEENQRKHTGKIIPFQIGRGRLSPPSPHGLVTVWDKLRWTGWRFLTRTSCRSPTARIPRDFR